MAAIVHIQAALTESYKRTVGTTSESSSASITEIGKSAVSQLQNGSIIGGASIRSSAFTASIVEPTVNCGYTGKLASDAVPQITITKIGKTLYGGIAWPDQTGSNWNQKRSASSSSKCPGDAEFNPIFGTLSATPSIKGFSSSQRFYSAVFAIPSPTTHGKTVIPVTMSAQGTVPNETDVTSASGKITISYSG